MYTLIVFQEIPEHTNFYLVPNSVLTEEHVRLLEDANNVIVNCDDSNDGTEFLSMALLPKNLEGDAEDSSPFYADRCLFADYRLGDDELPNTDFSEKPITRVISTGWMM